ncbi:MAG: hypothetical protein IPM95_02645 [Sphingobacteriales bacterium]|jgi:hypothetical protein|nr:hypothetical protein [Sphingobacteriales bacterium]
MNKYNAIQILFPLCCVFLIVSCHRDNTSGYTLTNPSPYFTRLYSLNDEAISRGINFNLTADEVKKTEKAKLYEATADHLFYEYSYPEDSTAASEYANLQYFFNENGQLDIITVDIFMNDSIQETHLKNTFIDYFSQRYGSSETDSYNYEVWKGNFDDKKLDKEFKYSVALKKLENESGISLEYIRE